MKQKNTQYSYLMSFLACVILAVCATPVALAKDKLPEVSSDGLHLLKNTKVRIAYAKPGMSLDKYTEVKLLDCFVQFKKNWQRDYNMDEVGLDGRVTDRDSDQIKKRVATGFNKVFTKELTNAGHSVVDEVGPNVLLIRPAIINLEVNAPDTMRAGMGATFVASAGQMTLYMELYDSSTSTLLARVIDPEGGRQGGFAMRANRATNNEEASRIFRHWAKLLNGHLADVKTNSSGH